MEREGSLSKKDFQNTVNPNIEELDEADQKEIESMPRPSFEEMWAIRNETPEETERAVKHIIEEAMEKVAPLGNLKRKIKRQSPN